ncbi:MAG: DUF222 domain-containing protein, partial [Propionibacteriaceae bacterium]|nr:DUF222 domain-containing protein [Propionibacteriaceae bacterium]
MAAALADEAITAAYAVSDEHLLDAGAVPGDARPHLDANGRLRESDDEWFDRLTLTSVAVGPALRLGKQQAANRVWDARETARLAPHAHARRLAGDWGTWHGHVFLDTLAHLSDEQITAADTDLAGIPGRVSVRALRARIHEWLREKGLPRTAADQQVENEGHAARCVTLGEPDLFGMASLNAYLPALEARAIDQLLTDLAGTAEPNDPRTAVQRRADVFLACFTGPAALNPAVAPQLGFAPAEVTDPRYAATSVDPAQQAAAEEAWESLRLIGATLGITFAKTPHVEVNVHVSATTMMDLAAARDSKHANSHGGTQDLPRHATPGAWNWPPDWHPPDNARSPGEVQPGAEHREKQQPDNDQPDTGPPPTGSPPDH